MGKRKKSSAKPQGPRKNTPLASTFQCLFCNHENSVSVKMEKKAGVGNLSCKICGQTYQAPINYLSAAVDVYADWIDACEDAHKSAAASGPPPPTAEIHPVFRNTGASQRKKGRDDEDDGGPDAETGDGGLGYEDDGFVVEDDDAAEAAYDDED